MTKLLNTVRLVTDTKFNYQTGTHTKSYVEIDVESLNALMPLLGAKTFAVHLIIISNWKNPNGLPSCKELAEITELSIRDVHAAVHKLLNFKINGVDLYNKERLNEKNIQNHGIYHV